MRYSVVCVSYRAYVLSLFLLSSHRISHTHASNVGLLFSFHRMSHTCIHIPQHVLHLQVSSTCIVQLLSARAVLVGSTSRSLVVTAFAQMQIVSRVASHAEHEQVAPPCGTPGCHFQCRRSRDGYTHRFCCTSCKFQNGYSRDRNQSTNAANPEQPQSSTRTETRSHAQAFTKAETQSY